MAYSAIDLREPPACAAVASWPRSSRGTLTAGRQKVPWKLFAVAVVSSRALDYLRGDAGAAAVFASGDVQAGVRCSRVATQQPRKLPSRLAARGETPGRTEPS